jgi:hypothetical protein
MNMPKPQTEKTINVIRGKNLVGKAEKPDVDKLIEHIDALEMFLDVNEQDDQFGTEGWRHAIGLD